MRLELRRGGAVVNVIEADLEWARAEFPDCEVVAAPLPEIQPPAAQPGPSPDLPRTKMTKYQFRRRFTLDELIKFDNPELFVSNLTAQQKAIARTLTRSFDAATEIDLADDQLQYGIQLMVQWGLLTAERAEQILDPTWAGV